MTMWRPELDRGGGPLFMTLANALERDAARGALAPGSRLPTHRDLAAFLGVTVGTVTRAYKEAARRGLVSGETGRGTYLRGPGQDKAPFSVAEKARDGIIDMGFTPPFPALDPDLGQALARISRRPDVQELLRYQPSGGRLRDRETGALWATRHGLRVAPENAVVCCGGQNALLCALMALFRPGERIAADAASYPMFKTLARRLGLALVPIRGDEGGMLPDALAEACRKAPVSGLYLMPSCHNPTTAVLSPLRRREIADIAEKHDLRIIEDGAYDAACGEGGEPMAVLAPGRTVFAAGVSKALAGGLRLSFLYGPPDMIPKLERAAADAIWTAPPLMAEIARLWLDDGTADAVMARKRSEAAARNVMAGEILTGLDLRQRQYGLFAWLLLPEPWRAADFTREAAERGVVVIPDEFFLTGQVPAPHAVRLALSRPQDRADMEKGLRILREILG